jgi:hypothetical protein
LVLELKAYQRYISLPAAHELGTNTDPRWFYEVARQSLQATFKEECVMHGIDEGSAWKALVIVPERAD